MKAAVTTHSNADAERLLRALPLALVLGALGWLTLATLAVGILELVR